MRMKGTESDGRGGEGRVSMCDRGEKEDVYCSVRVCVCVCVCVCDRDGLPVTLNKSQTWLTVTYSL